MARNDAFDRLTELAAALFQAPIALITVLDEESQRFRSSRGFGADQTTVEESFCRHMIRSAPGTTMVVENATLDSRFADNRVVTEQGVRFYAGAVITTEDGDQDGAVCVIDTVVRPAPTDAQMQSLKLLAQLAGQEIDHARLRRRQAEHTAMLEMSEAMAGVGHWHYDLTSGKVRWSDEVFRIHGLVPQSIDPTVHSQGDQYHPEDRVDIWRLMERACRTGEGYDTRLRLYRDGKELVTRTHAKVERDETGAIVALFGVFQDITDSVRAQEQQAAYVETLLLAETMADVGHWRMDVATREISWSEAVYRLHGVEAGTVDPTAHSFADATYPLEDREKTRALIARAIQTGEGYETQMRVIRPNGEERVGRAQAACEVDMQGNVTALYGVVQDITDMVRAQERTLRSEALFRLMSETSTDIIAQYRPNGEFLYISQSVAQVLGYPPEHMIGKRSRDFIHPDDRGRANEAFSALVAEWPVPQHPHIIYRAIRADGSTIWLEASPRPVFDAAGQLIEMHDHVRDVTARIASEQEQRELVDTLQLAEELAELGSWKLDLVNGRVRWSDQVYRIHGVNPRTYNPTALNLG